MKDMTEEEIFRLDMGFNYWSDNKIDMLKDLENPANEGKVKRMIDVLHSDVITSSNPEAKSYYDLMKMGEEAIAKKWVKPKITRRRYW